MKLAFELSGGAQDTLRCLFFHGPTWDGDIPSKAGRGELCDAGYAEHRSGFAYLTAAGVQAALGLDLDQAKEKWQRDRGAWRPIAKAQKDGTKYLLARIDPDHGVLWAVQGFWSERRQNWNDGVEPSGLASPTHFLPVPGRWLD